MKKYGVVAVLVVIIGAVWYYRRRSAQIEQEHVNPNASVSDALGSLASGYERSTGAIAAQDTANERYNSYLDYLKSGGPDSGKTFDQYLTASESQSLPTNS